MRQEEVKSVFETSTEKFDKTVNELLKKGYKLQSSNSSYQPETESTTNWPVFTAILVKTYDDGVLQNF